MNVGKQSRPSAVHLVVAIKGHKLNRCVRKQQRDWYKGNLVAGLG